MSEGPKRFSLSDYQSKRGTTKPAESVVSTHEQKNELEELHMLLGTGTNGNHSDILAANDADDAGFLRTPGASPNNGEGRAALDASGNASEEGEDVEMDGRSASRSDKRESRDSKSSRRRHRRRGRRSRSPSKSASRSRSRSHSRSPSSSRRRRSRAHSASRSGSRDNDRRSRSRSRKRRSHRGGRDRDRSSSASKDKISMRCVFPYEDGGIIIGLRGAHLSKLRKSIPSVDWRISNETNDRQDRILVVRGTVKHIAEAFKALAEHFISQGMHVDYPQQTRGRGTKEVDTSKPFVPIRLLMPHKTCGAIIGQKSETLINTRVNCAARRVYVYRERISESRERVVEIVGTPGSIARVMEVLGDQVARTLNSDQQESELYTPERDGLRKFLGKQGVPRSRVSLEPIKEDEKNGAAAVSSSKKGASRKKSRSRSVSSSDESDASERSRGRARGRHGRSSRRSRRSRSRSYSRSRSRSRSPGAKSHRSSRRSRRSRHRGHEKSSRSSRRHRDRSWSRSSSRSSASNSRSRSPSYSRSRSRSHSRSRSRSRSKSKSKSRSRSKSRRKGGSGSSRRGTNSHRRRRSSRAKVRRQNAEDKDEPMHEASDAEMDDADVAKHGTEVDGERLVASTAWENGDLSVDAWAVTNDEASDKAGAVEDGGSW